MLVQLGPAAAPPQPPSSSVFRRPSSGKTDDGRRKTDDHITIRPARVTDMRQVEPLINRFAREQLMLPKTYDQLARNFREFVVAVDEQGRVVGCGALRVYTDSLAELASLAVDESLHGSGVGRRLVEAIVAAADELGLKTVFALTLRAFFFERLGFHTVTRERFPLKVWADCRNCPKLHACDEIAVAIELADLGGRSAAAGVV